MVSEHGLRVQPQPDGTLVIGVTGRLDLADGTALAAAVLAVPPDVPGVVLDLAEVTGMSAAGFRALAGASARLADHGQRLVLARCPARLSGLLRDTGAARLVGLAGTVAEALAALSARPGRDVSDLARVRARAQALPAALQTRPVIEGATALVRRRYGIADNERAFAVLREASQRHNLKLRTLAAALLTVRPPDMDRPVWFVGRRRQPPPPTTFTPVRQDWRDNRAAFLSGVLDTALACMGTDHGDLSLADPIVGGLRLELHRGLPPQFTALWGHVDDEEVACAQAFRLRVRVVVPDVTVHPAYAAPAARTVMAAADTRAVQSTPMISPDGHCRGIVSTLHTRAGRVPSAAEAAMLDRIGREAGGWLMWYQHTIVLDALEYLHQAARTATRRPDA